MAGVHSLFLVATEEKILQMFTAIECTLLSPGL